MTRIVKNAFTYRFGHGGTVNVPAGARVGRPVPGGEDTYWVDPSVFPRHSLDRHDATYRGIRVPLDNTEEA